MEIMSSKMTRNRKVMRRVWPRGRARSQTNRSSDSVARAGKARERRRKQNVGRTDSRHPAMEGVAVGVEEAGMTGGVAEGVARTSRDVESSVAAREMTTIETLVMAGGVAAAEEEKGKVMNTLAAVEVGVAQEGVVEVRSTMLEVTISLESYFAVQVNMDLIVVVGETKRDPILVAMEVKPTHRESLHLPPPMPGPEASRHHWVPANLSSSRDVLWMKSPQ